MTCQSTETSAFSFRIQQRLGNSGYPGGGCGGGGQVARRGRVQGGGASDPVHRRCGPRRKFLDKVVLVAAGVRIDKVVDAPVVMQRRSLHASSTVAFGRISPYSTCVLASLEI